MNTFAVTVKQDDDKVYEAVNYVTESLSSARIIEITTSGSDSIIEYNNSGMVNKMLLVDETVTALMLLLSPSEFVKVTVKQIDSDPELASTAYLTKILPVASMLYFKVSGSTDTLIALYKNGMIYHTYVVDETYASIAAATAAIEGQSSATGITAFATGGQGSATQLVASFNELTTVATAGDSVKLPSAAAGGRITVKNNGAAAADIFPATGDSINALAVNTAIRIAPGSTISFYAVDSTVWEADNQVLATETGSASIPTFTYSIDPDTGMYRSAANTVAFACGGVLIGGFNSTGLFVDQINAKGTSIYLANQVLRNTQTALIAHAGGGQGSATPVYSDFNRVTTVATTGDSVILPPAKVGMVKWIDNDGANSMNVFPDGTEQINAGGAGTQLAHAAAARKQYICYVDGFWVAK